ncbi:MAG: NAD(P)/FAD-dependent oxidoreductase, partial [Sphingomonadaceae bacterium]
TADADFRAGKVLIAAGAWTAHVAALANLHMPLYPVALLMNATERTAPVLPQLIQHVGRRLSMKQTHAGNILIGGGWPSRLAQKADGGFDLAAKPSIIEASLAGNLRAGIDTVPMIERLNLIRSWTGVTAISADQLPIVGEVPRMPGLFVAGGGSAFTLGPTFARLLARAMTGERVAELDLLSPARFEHLNSFMG